jgi:undecaprenyl-diphosphatase
MSLLHVIILAIIQGLAELLPVSSSAHVVVAEKLMGMNPTAPAMTLLLVMLHTGTMFAVIAYFWNQWRRTYFRDAATFKTVLLQLFVASFVTAIIGYGLIEGIEKLVLHGKHAQVEQLFGRLDLIAPALAAVGILILIAGLRHSREQAGSRENSAGEPLEGSTGLNMNQAGWIGGIQGLCLPFRGFSRSGATISTGMLLGVAKARAEEFSFALAVILTPPAIAREVWRLAKARHLTGAVPIASAMVPSLVGMLFAFLAGLVALKWLSRWLETGRWYWFGIYCLVAAVAVGYLHHIGY